jgi:hypothetical protein
MSARVSGAVWGESRDGERLGGSRHGGSTLLVLLALADFSHDDGGSIYPSISTLAQKTRLSERQVQRTIAILEKSGEVFVHRGAGPGGVNLYTINLKVLGVGGDKMTPPVTDATAGGDAHVTTGVTHVAPDPSSEPLLNLRSGHPPNSSSRKGRKRPFPDDFVLTSERRAKIAGEHGLDADAFFKHFEKRCRSEPTRYRYLNWDLALDNWCEREGPTSRFRTTTGVEDRPRPLLKDATRHSMGGKTQERLEQERSAELASRAPGASLFDAYRPQTPASTP